MNLFNLISYILTPKKAVDYADNLLSDIKNNKGDRLEKIKAIGYLNEFFSKYISWGKSNKEVVSINKQVDSGKYSNDKLLNALLDLRMIRLEAKKYIDAEKYSKEPERRVGVSGGVAHGTTLNIKSINQNIPKNTIGIFPTARTKYINLFNKCSGMIFLSGGITSHGAIIAREFGIPAIIYPKLKIRDGEKISINGDDGYFELLT